MFQQQTYLDTRQSFGQIWDRWSKETVSWKYQKFFRIKDIWQKDLKKILHRTGNKISSEYKIISKQIQLLKIIINNLANIEDARNCGNRLSKIVPGPTTFKKVRRILWNPKFCTRLIRNDILITNSHQISDIFIDYYTIVFQEVIPERPVSNIENQILLCVNEIPQHIYTFDDNFQSDENSDSFHFTNVSENITTTSIVKNHLDLMAFLTSWRKNFLTQR